jgi:hypothetical protein
MMDYAVKNDTLMHCYRHSLSFSTFAFIMLDRAATAPEKKLSERYEINDSVVCLRTYLKPTTLGLHKLVPFLLFMSCHL